MTCECAECTNHGGPDPQLMTLRFMVIIAQMTVGLYGMLKERSLKALGAWLGAFALFWTVPRYFICARCAGYGNNCYSLYLGKITSLYMPKVEGHEQDQPPALAILLEVLALVTISNAPMLGLRRDKKLLGLYMLLSSLTIWSQFLHACRHCATYSQDWKKECPSAQTYRRLFG